MTVAVSLALAAPARAQLGGLGKALEKGKKGLDTFEDLRITDAEEQQMGADISAMLREKYGVVQDRNVHKYVALVGTTLAQASTRPNLRWTFVVLDTDGVNAFAAPGGYVHITRGALALIQNEAELANVLGHEIGHITAKHTIDAVKQGKRVSLVAEATRQQVLEEFTKRLYEAVLENKFDRDDETDSDKTGITLASRTGYAPQGLAAFLNKLAERNKGLKEPSGVFASHPETRARLDAMNRVITSQRLTATALVAPRYSASISYKPVPVSSVAQVAPPTQGAATAKPEESKGGGGLSRSLGLGRERSSSSTVASAGSRGVNPDRDAKGGPNKAAVVVTVTAAEIAEFKKGITG